MIYARFVPPRLPIATFSFSFSFSSCASEIGETKKLKASGPFGGRDMFLDCNYAILYFHYTKYIRMLDTCVRNFGQARSTNLPNNPIHPFEATFCHQRALFSLSLFCNSNALASASSLPQWPWFGVILAAAKHVYAYGPKTGAAFLRFFPLLFAMLRNGLLHNTWGDGVGWGGV